MEPEHNSPFNSFFLELEAGEWDQKRVLDRASIKNGPAALSRLIQKIEKNIDIYSKKKPKLTMARKKRDLYHLKNTMLIDDLRTEKSGLELMRCDGVSSVINYHNNRCRLLDSESKLIQPLEMYLNTNLEKYSLRLTGYPRTLLDSLHDRPDNEVNRKIASRMWRLQRQTAAIIGGEKFETKPIEHPRTLLEMLSFLQLGEAICSRDFNRIEDMASYLDMFFISCVEILVELYEWNENLSPATSPHPSQLFDNCTNTPVDDIGISVLSENEGEKGSETVSGHEVNFDAPLLPIVLCQCIHTLRCVLMCDAGFIQCRKLSADNVAKYNMLMAKILGKWMLEMTAERRQPFMNVSKKAAMLTGHVSYFSPLVADTLICAKCALQVIVHDSGVPNLVDGIGSTYSSSVEFLIQSCEPLALCSLNEVSNHLTNERRVCKGDLKCMESLYGEAQCALSFIAACFSTGWVSASMLELLAAAKQLGSDVRKNLSIQSPWLQVILAGVLFINMSTTEVETDEEYATRIKQAQIDKLQGKEEMALDGSEGRKVLRQKLCAFLASCILDVLKAMEVFPTTPTLLHTGLLTVRLLLRLPYMNKKEIVTFLEGEQANEMRSAADIRAERMLKLQEEHNLANVDDDDISIEDFYVWKEKNLDDDDTFIDDWKGEASLPISRLLFLVGEKNIQSLEVIEQWLLLIRHLCLSSPMALMSLAEANMESAIEKVLTIQNDDLYTVALGRICLNELAKLEPDSY